MQRLAAVIALAREGFRFHRNSPLNEEIFRGNLRYSHREPYKSTARWENGDKKMEYKIEEKRSFSTSAYLPATKEKERHKAPLLNKT